MTDHLDLIICLQRLLRDDPSKGLTEIKEPIKLQDIFDAWKDSSMWGMYFIGLVAYIPATPVSGYLSLTLKRLGFTTFNSNMLTIPAAVLQIILMLSLSRSSDYFKERTWHCFFGEFWVLPLLVTLICLPAGGLNWPRFAVTTMISGCKSTSVKKSRMSLTKTSLIRSILPSHCFCVDQ